MCMRIIKFTVEIVICLQQGESIQTNFQDSFNLYTISAEYYSTITMQVTIQYSCMYMYTCISLSIVMMCIFMWSVAVLVDYNTQLW